MSKVQGQKGRVNVQGQLSESRLKEKNDRRQGSRSRFKVKCPEVNAQGQNSWRSSKLNKKHK